ncbi:MAG: hypothetical protein F4Z07_06220 [Dehalococcoidia bacterium]|nr:hypothetical protein [Dehalococcoidia bacterium]
MTLDHNREPDVWAAVYGKLIEGTGRMLRIKPRRRDRPGIPTVTRYWAMAYERIEPWLEEPEKKLIQVGMEINRNRREPEWARAYAVAELSQAVQQRMRVLEDRIVQGRTPELHVPRGRGRPRKE